MRNKKINNEIIKQAHKEAVRVLENCIHSIGIKASAGINGYPQIWARDSMITLLGACLLGDKTINKALYSSSEVLRKNRSLLGIIPNNVDVRSGKTNFQAYADGGLWFVIGTQVFYQETKDILFLKKNYPAIKKILHWYKYQDIDNSGLISIQEGSDWEDLFATRGKGLYVNTLYYLALLKGAYIAKILGDKRNQNFFSEQARYLGFRINEKFWFTENKPIFRIIEQSFGTENDLKEKNDVLDRKFILPSKTILKKDSYYLPYITFRDFGEWFDSFGNLLAIIAGIAGKKRAKAILKFIEKYKLAEPYPIKAIYPPIFPGRKDWRYYYKFGNLNLPHQYHNGGIWPFLGGFYVAALVKMSEYRKAQDLLLALALLNKNGRESDWEFNEWFHGKNAKPMGIVRQAWSAGMYIYAYECVHRKKAIFF